MLKFISHRGNLFGQNLERENSPNYILEAIYKGFQCEIDIWSMENSSFWLGHNAPTYQINKDFLEQYCSRLWMHAKNLHALERLSRNPLFNVFWHQEDAYTLTSLGHIWTYPYKITTPRSILVIQDKKYDIKNLNCFGICSDYVEFYRDKYYN